MQIPTLNFTKKKKKEEKSYFGGVLSYCSMWKFDEKFQVSKNLSNEGGIKHPIFKNFNRKSDITFDSNSFESFCQRPLFQNIVGVS